MHYQIVQAREADKQAIYDIKKNSIMEYVSEIWGWDEDFQAADFETGFVVSNFKVILCKNEIIGFLELNEDERVTLRKFILSHCISEWV